MERGRGSAKFRQGFLFIRKMPIAEGVEPDAFQLENNED